MGTIKTDNKNSPFPEVSTFLFDPHLDFRGAWQRIWDLDSIRAVGHNPKIEQVSISTNPQAHTLRGMHSLKPEASEFKAVICLTGAVQDVLIDVRPNSPTWGTYASFVLDAKYLNGVLIPPGFAHGFLTLAAETRLLYLMSVKYDAALENNYCWNDPEFAIEWLSTPTLISEKDNTTPWISSR